MSCARTRREMIKSSNDGGYQQVNEGGLIHSPARWSPYLIQFISYPPRRTSLGTSTTIRESISLQDGSDTRKRLQQIRLLRALSRFLRRLSLAYSRDTLSVRISTNLSTAIFLGCSTLRERNLELIYQCNAFALRKRG